MLMATDLAALDHHEGTVTLIANAVNWDATDERVDLAYDDAVARLEQMTQTLAAPAAVPAAIFEQPEPVFTRRTAGGEYREMVEVAKEHIRAGDAFQIVLSQRFDVPTTAQPLEIYRVLRATNPSPYMYLLQLPTPTGRPLAVVGSSPEALVTVRDGHVTMHPIAGTRPRGVSEEDDVLLAKDLLADLKERSEHVMLVDLGRNDLGRVCSPGTVKVVDFFTVERYSHVMHIVSTVTGSLAPGRTAFDALTACFPAGTLSGAPKPRAMQIIDELEPARRGIYGGIVGYLDFAGDADTAITIGPPCSPTGWPTSRRAPVWSPIRCRPPRTPNARTRPPPSSPPWPPRPRCGRSAVADRPRSGAGAAVLAVLLVVGAVALVVGAGLTWWTQTHLDSLAGSVTVKAKGSQTDALLIPVALLALAGFGAALATTGVLRRLVGVVLVLGGAWAATLAIIGLWQAPASLHTDLTRPPCRQRRRSCTRPAPWSPHSVDCSSRWPEFW